VIKKSVLAIAALTMMMYSPPAHAALSQLTLIGGGQICIFDFNLGATVSINPGSTDCTGLTPTIDQDHGTVSLTSSVWDSTGFTVAITAAGGTGTTLPTEQTLNQVDVTSGASGSTLDVFFTDTFYATPGDSFLFGATSTIDTQISTSTVDNQASYDAGNGIPATGLLCQFTLTGLVDADSCTAPNPSPSDTEYSLTTHTVVTFIGPPGGHVQNNSTISIVSAVPEPASIFLLGTLITAAIGFRQRFIKRS